MVSFASPKVWNSLPLSLREIETLSLIEKHLEAFNFNLAFLDVTIVEADIWLLIAVDLVTLLCFNFISVKLFYLNITTAPLNALIDTCWCCLRGDINCSYSYHYYINIFIEFPAENSTNLW